MRLRKPLKTHEPHLTPPDEKDRVRNEQEELTKQLRVLRGVARLSELQKRADH